MTMLEIRVESVGEEAAIHHVNAQAFARQNEADLVDALRDSGEFIISMVALHDGQIVGHVLFSPVRIESDDTVKQAIALGPLAVLPDYQRQGIGLQLIEHGLQACKDNGFTIAIVLGHPTLYPRFGFVPAKPLGIQWEHDVPEDVFMVMPLADNALAGVTGVVKYHTAFNGV
jgi:putative acetyltransferase